MTNTDISCVHRKQPDPPRLRHIVTKRRIAEEDLEYHVKAHQTFRLFAQLIELAENLLAKYGTGHYGSNRVRQLRRLLFEAEIADARELLASLSKSEDALHVWCCAGDQRGYLAYAVAEYLDLGSMSPDQIIAWAEAAS
jgi:hypothetical protein